MGLLVCYAESQPEKREANVSSIMNVTFVKNFDCEPIVANSSSFMNRSNDISGTFRPLTPAQIKGNALFVALWSATFLIVIVGVVLAVKTGLMWIAVVSGAMWVCALLLVANIRSVRYVPKFGRKYNILRSLFCGFLVYSGVAWRGLLGFYHRFVLMDERGMSISAFGWTVMAVSLTVMLISKLSLYRVANVHVADFIGAIEMMALAVFIGSIMFMLLYT